jgi:hypothetical protein
MKGDCIAGNCIDGRGTYLEANGTKYIGQFKNRTYTGKGEIEYSDGNWYKGDFFNGYRHGRGELKWNGDHYIGGFSYDRYSGKGTLFYANGNKYEGEFLEGYRHGFGRIEWNGATYTGEFEYDKWSGKGVLKQANGDRYEGHFKAGNYSGHGKLTYANGNIYAGDFLKGKRHGKGTLVWNGDRYTGEFKYDKYSGQGTLVKADGSRYTGDFLNGFYNGSGRIIYDSGKYEGQWKRGLWHGIGAYTYADGKTYRSYFENGCKVGMGTYTWGKDEERILKWEMSNKARHQIYETITTLLSEENYEDIDRIAQDYRRSKTLFPNGLWKLPVLYYAVTDVDINAPEASWHSHLEILEKWVNSEPNSITAQIALADFYISYAFRGRGYSVASQVTDEGWKLFRQRLEKAAGVLNRAEKLKTKCPHYWSVSLSLAKAQNANLSSFRKILKHALSYEPFYLSYYFKTAGYLMPRWHGKEGAWEAFAHAAANMVGDRSGDFIYAQIIISMNGDPPYDSVLNESHRITWPQVKRGLESIADFEKAIKSGRQISRVRLVLMQLQLGFWNSVFVSVLNFCMHLVNILY